MCKSVNTGLVKNYHKDAFITNSYESAKPTRETCTDLFLQISIQRNIYFLTKESISAKVGVQILCSV